MAGLWILVIVGAIIGGFEFVNMFMVKEVSAPQQAAVAAMAVAWAVIPYVFVRAIEKAVGPEHRELKRLNETAEALLASLNQKRRELSTDEVTETNE